MTDRRALLEQRAVALRDAAASRKARRARRRADLASGVSRDQLRYQARIAAGRCLCGAELPEKASRCATCAAADRAVHKARKLKLRAEGLCIDCGGPALGSRCAGCAATHRDRVAADRGATERVQHHACSRCRAAGHNRRTCPAPAPVSEAA